MRDINIFDTDMFPYLEGEELLKKTLTLTIQSIKPEKLRNSAGKEETKEVVYFKESQKGLVLNKTNAKRIAQLYGKMTGQWAGKQITLYTEPVQAFGEPHNALRVAPAVPNGDVGMNLEKLLTQLNRLPKIKNFYKTVKDINPDGEAPPDPSDLEVWRDWFVQARDYALETLEADRTQASEPMSEAQAVEAARSAMDEVEEAETNSWPDTFDGFILNMLSRPEFKEWSDEDIRACLKKAALVETYSPRIAHRMQIALMKEEDNRSAMDEVEAEDAVAVAGDMTSDQLAEMLAELPDTDNTANLT